MKVYLKKILTQRNSTPMTMNVYETKVLLEKEFSVDTVHSSVVYDGDRFAISYYPEEKKYIGILEKEVEGNGQFNSALGTTVTNIGELEYDGWKKSIIY